MWHGFGQFSKTWETTPDGREGFQNIFPRRRHSVYILDQPRRGRAGRSMEEHWHGAGAKVPMSHAVVHERFDTQEVTWMQKVSDEEYGNAACEP